MQFSWLKNPTAVVMLVLTLAFIWVQWPTRNRSDLPQSYHWIEQTDPDFRIRFETEPVTDSITDGNQTVRLFTDSRKGLDLMLQEITPATLNPDEWLALSLRNDQEQFSGRLAMQWQFQRQGITVHEYVLTNELHFVNQVRVIFTPDAVFKLAAGYKESEDPELMARVLGFMDSFSLKSDIN